jgi:hypothetical protein
MSNINFIEKATKIHEYKYDYSRTSYTNIRTKIEIICPKHGSFWQTPLNHLHGRRGCPKCGQLSRSKTKMLSTQEFILKSQQTHENKYDYSRVLYRGCNEKVEIICPKHGSFWQNASKHIGGCGCPKCGLNTKDIDAFVTEARQIHGNVYDYSCAQYKRSDLKIEIICPLHGSFTQRPNDHLQGQGCPKCKFSKGENKIQKILYENNIVFCPQHTFSSCKNPLTNRLLKFDFYLPEHNLCIEFDGFQHFRESVGCKIGHMKNRTFTKQNWEHVVYLDSLKNQWCLKHHVRLLRIAFKQINSIYSILKEQGVFNV